MKKKMMACLTVLGLLATGNAMGGSTIDLSGTWQVQLDPRDEGLQGQWYTKELSDTMRLPGSTDQAGLGERNGPESALNGRLSRQYQYEGPAWYRREIDIPAEWIGKPVELYLERVHMASRLWVNGEPVGAQNSVSAAHRYDVSDVVRPGKNTICFRITNRMEINLGRWSHSSSNETMGNWNGAVGKLELRCHSDQYLSGVRVGSDLSKKTIWVDGAVRQKDNVSSTGDLVVGIIDPESGKIVAAGKQTISLSSTNAAFRVEMNMPDDVKLWDEFSPNLYNARIQFKGSRSVDEQTVRFGVREIAAKDRQFTINGRPTFMRGNLHCGEFPLTGYFPMEKAYWEKIIRTAKAYGLNHFRFHSYNPPHVAFEVGDELGFYFCPEGPFWSHFKEDSPEGEYLVQECHKMLEEYGNHASFVMMGPGNEVGGDNPFISRLMVEMKEADSRRLYNSDVNDPGTGKRKEPLEGADFFVSRWTKSPGSTVRVLGHRFVKPVLLHGTEKDYRTAVQDVEIPFMAHELGQWVVHPSFSEIPTYTGVMQPYNLKHFRTLLERNGMGPQARELCNAGARLGAQLYREDMEICFRTPGMGGFQLLQLQDFPGQGDALVGLLDVFWDPKGTTTPEEFRQGCSETVLLARFPNYALSNTDTFEADIEVAHYGPKPFDQARIEWRLVDQSGKRVGGGVLNAAQIPVGNVFPVGAVQAPLSSVSKASQLTFELALSGTPYKNSWPIWVYPSKQSIAVPSGILLAREYDQQVKDTLRQGGMVLLSVPSQTPTDDMPRIMRRRFLPIFWNFLWRNNREASDLGILVDPSHPALADFPTGNFASWQWSELLNNSRAFVLNELPDEYRPIVQSIDDFHRAWKLGALFEGKVGNGKIIVTGMDLHDWMDRRKVARQLRQSLFAYMQSDAFNPQQELDLDLLYEKSIATQKGVVYASSSVVGGDDKGPASQLEIIQGELDEFNTLKSSSAVADGAAAAFDLNWETEWLMDGSSLPQEVQIDLKRVASLNGVVYKPAWKPWRRVRKFDVYVKEVEDSPWQGPVLEYVRQEDSNWCATLPFQNVVEARYVKFVIKEGFENSKVLGVTEFEPWFK